MANLKTKNVFVDTEVFEASNFNFSSKGLSVNSCHFAVQVDLLPSCPGLD